MSFRHLFDDTNVIFELESTTKDGVLKEMVEYLSSSKRLTKKQVPVILEAVLEREKQGATGIGKGVALPHAKHSGLKKMVALLARCKDGIDFEAADHRPVNIFFMVLSPESVPEEHIKFLRWISSLARQGDFRSFVPQAKSVEEMLGLLDEFGGSE